MNRKLVNDLTDVMARVLYYQEHQQPSVENLSYEQARIEAEQLPPQILQRYRNDHVFHAQVTRAVAMVLRVLPPTAAEKP